MIRNAVPVPSRRRDIPEGFGWVDHRLAREGYFRGMSSESLALYLFLVTVANADGVSWFSEQRLCRELGLSYNALAVARKELIDTGLVTYSKPHYQVLDLPQENLDGTFRELLHFAEAGSKKSSSQNNETCSPEKFRNPYRREASVESVSLGEVLSGMIHGGSR